MGLNDPQENFLNLEIFKGRLFNEHLLRDKFFDVLKSAYTRTCHNFYISVNDETLHNLNYLTIESKKSDFNVHVNGAENIQIETSTNIIVINTKYNQKWNFEADVKEQMNSIEQHPDEKNAIQVLLVSKKIWEDNRKHSEDMIQYKKLRNHLRHEQGEKVSFIVLFWEDILEFLEEKEEVNPAYLSLKKILETP